MHPAAEEMELSFIGPSLFIASANTTTVGPGYHIFLTALLKDLAEEFGASWENPENDSGEFRDETAFFVSGDEDHLKAEMTTWLSAVARLVFKDTKDRSAWPMAICLPLNIRFEAELPAVTALGPRDREWLMRTAEDGKNGVDFFSWREPGFTAEYYLRRALTQMWTNVRWRPPISDVEAAVLEDVAASLKRGFEIDPSLDYPWAEWKQVIELLETGGPDLEFVESRVKQEPSIGYRRRLLTVALPGGWGIRIPGSFSDFAADEQGDSSSVDPPREIWFTAYQLGDASSRTYRLAKKEIRRRGWDHVIEEDEYCAQANITEKERGEERYFVLNSSNLAPGTRSVCTILFPSSDERDWAIETWRSITPPSDQKG